MSWERVLFPDIESAKEFASHLDALNISVRFARVTEHFNDGRHYSPELILIGSSVSVEFAVRVVALAIERWSLLYYRE